MTSTLIDVILGILSVIVAPFIIKGVFEARTKRGKLLQIIFGVALVAVFLIIWGKRRDPLQWLFCWLQPDAKSCQNISGSKTALDIPSFDGSLSPLPGVRRNSKQGVKFNEFMLEHSDQVVFLSVYLTDDMSLDLTSAPDEYGRIVFTVPDDYDQPRPHGNEYLIHLSDKAPKGFDFNHRTGKLSGYFRIWGINGPRQGYMSVNLRPVKIN